MSDYQRIATAIEFLQTSAIEQPSLDNVAQHVGLSSFHFQRLFKRFAGVSPKRFLQHLTSEYAKELLRSSESVLETSFAVGLSSPGRLHDLMVNVEAVTPGEYKSRGERLRINYGFHPTPFGNCLIAVTDRGICRLEFQDSAPEEDYIQNLMDSWPNAMINRNPGKTQGYIEQIFTLQQRNQTRPIHLFLKGTNFQLKVWQALLNIPSGCITSYGYLAKQIDQPHASRAVGTALGNNPIGYLIPCHRVLRGDGAIGGYRWGTNRKLAILGCEFGHSDF